MSQRSDYRSRLFVLAISVALIAGSVSLRGVSAQSGTGDWEKAAGAKLSFDVVSVKRDTAALIPGTAHTNIPLGYEDLFAPTGGLLTARNFPLIVYISFAFKLTPRQEQAVQNQLPKWASAERFDIEARATGNPSKDQYRLMMQTLLEDRFKLAIHFETKQVPVYVIIFDKPGKLGPHIQRHTDSSSCANAITSGSGPIATVAGGYPETCGAFVEVRASNPGRVRLGARNMDMAMVATSISLPQFGVDRPVLDGTGLTGTYDFVVEFTPPIDEPLPPGETFQPDASGPTLLEALKEQLGLKLDSTNGPFQTLVIDHVEEPSEN